MKATKTVINQRIDELLRVRLDGAQFHDIVQYVAEKGWGLKDRQIRNYLRRADDLLVERREKSRRGCYQLHVARRESLYARAVNAADYRTALVILTDLARLQELYVSAKEVREIRADIKKLEEMAGCSEKLNR